MSAANAASRTCQKCFTIHGPGLQSCEGRQARIGYNNFEHQDNHLVEASPV